MSLFGALKHSDIAGAVPLWLCYPPATLRVKWQMCLASDVHCWICWGVLLR